MGIAMWQFGIFTVSALAVFAAGPQHAAAQDAPRAYTVPAADAGSDPKIGAPVRAKPSRRAREIGVLAPGSRPVEVLETDRTNGWGRIIWGEGDGWVDLRGLDPAELPLLPDSAIPIGLLCLGTEPFWDVRVVSGTKMRIRRLDGVTAMAEIGGAAASRTGNGFPAMVWGDGGGLAARLLLRPGECSDGASSRIYGWVGDVVIVEEGGQSLLSGCCYLPLNN